MSVKRYYYKSKDGKVWYNLKSPLKEKGYIEITEKEWNEHSSQKHQVSAEELAKQEKRNQISALKRELANTDYQALKFFEGWLTEQEYAPIKAKRQELRNQINQLESEI